MTVANAIAAAVFTEDLSVGGPGGEVVAVDDPGAGESGEFVGFDFAAGEGELDCA
jgi:hypothetical protein